MLNGVFFYIQLWKININPAMLFMQNPTLL